MPKTKYVDFKAVKAAVSIVQILDHYGLTERFKRSGDSLSGPCPLHGGDNPTQFRVSISKNCWNCFSECKHGGNTIDFVMRKENCTIRQAALRIAEWFNLPTEASPDDSDNEQPARRREHSDKPATRERNHTPTPAKQPEPEPSGPNKPLSFQLKDLNREHPYLTNERGLNQQTIIDFGLGYFTGTKGLMVGRIVIPIHNSQGELVAYGGRWPGEPPDEETPKYKLPPGFKKSLELFNLDRAINEPADKPLVLVEGFFDVIQLHQLGWRKVVALMGSSMSDAQEELIRRHTNSGSHVIVMLDEDEAGQAGRDDIACRLAKFCFVTVHVFEQPGTQPEHLSEDELAGILEGVLCV